MKKGENCARVEGRRIFFGLEHEFRRQAHGASLGGDLGEKYSTFFLQAANFSPGPDPASENPFVLKVFTDGTAAAWQSVVKICLYQAAAMSARVHRQDVISKKLATASTSAFQEQKRGLNSGPVSLIWQAISHPGQSRNPRRWFARANHPRPQPGIET